MPISDQRNEFCIFLSSKCLWCLPVDSFGIVFRCGGGDMRVMAVLCATVLDIKSVESRFLWNFVMWMEGIIMKKRGKREKTHEKPWGGIMKKFKKKS